MTTDPTPSGEDHARDDLLLRMRKDPASAMEHVAKSLPTLDTEHLLSEIDTLGSIDNGAWAAMAIRESSKTISYDLWAEHVLHLQSKDQITDGRNLKYLFQIYENLWQKDHQLDERVLESLNTMKKWASVFETSNGSRYYKLPSGQGLRYRPGQTSIHSTRLQSPELTLGFVPEAVAKQWTSVIDEWKLQKGANPNTHIERPDITIHAENEAAGLLTLRQISTTPTIGKHPLGIATFDNFGRLSHVNSRLENGVMRVSMTALNPIGDGFAFPPDHRGNAVTRII